MAAACRQRTYRAGYGTKEQNTASRLYVSRGDFPPSEQIRKADREARTRPHDLRRTYAQLGYNAGVPITQISVLLGHSSIKTTQEYLNLNLDLESTASDFVPLAG